MRENIDPSVAYVLPEQEAEPVQFAQESYEHVGDHPAPAILIDEESISIDGLSTHPDIASDQSVTPEDAQVSPPLLPGLYPLESPRALLKRAHQGDARAREQVAVDNLPLARELAARYATGSESMDDITQVANIGLIKAIKRFDPSRGTAFSTYATPTIVGEIKRHFRDHGWVMKVERSVKERALKVAKIIEASPNDHECTTESIALQLQISEAEVEEARHIWNQGYRLDSLNAPTGEEDSEAEYPEKVEYVGDPRAGAAYAARNERIDLLRAIDKLPNERWKLAVVARMHDQTHREIGKKLGISPMQVCRDLAGATAFIAAECGA